MNSRSTIAAAGLLAMLLAPAPAAADTPSRAALLTGRYGSANTTPAYPTLPPEMMNKVFDYAEKLAWTRLDEAPKKLERKDFYDMEKFASWAEGLRSQRELAAFLSHHLTTDQGKKRFGERRAAQLKEKLDAVVKNRDAHIKVLADGWTEELKQRAADRERARNMPSIGLPSRPRPPSRIMSPQYMVATEGLIPSPYGDAIGVGSMFKGAPRILPILDAINTGYSAGGWMGNEVIIKAQMRENWERKKDYERRVKEWDEKVKPLWEENERRRRRDAMTRQQLEFRIFVALYGYPKLNPALGTYSGNMGYNGGLYGPAYGGLGTYGRGTTGPALGAGMLRD